MRILSIALLAAFIQATAPPQDARGSIRGTIVKWGSSDSLPQTIVELRPETGSRPVASTAASASGEFFFPNVAAGRYRVIATRSGYAPAEYGQRRPGGS